VPWLFSGTLFVSAFLLFLVQPMIAKMILPRLGGAPAVWNTCMVFYQATLLVGYAYAHVVPARLGLRRQALLHVGLLFVPFLFLPISVAGWRPPVASEEPVFWLLTLLVACTGFPFFVVATSAPLLQKWFASTGHPAAKDPYFLYAASNVGSLAALLSYPVVFEPYLRLANQSWFWTASYVLLVVLTAACAYSISSFSREHLRARDDRARKCERLNEDAAKQGSSLPSRLRWVALAFVPSSLMLGVTSFISTDIAAIPLLWIVPLAIYLLTFILVFARLPVLLHRAMIVVLPIGLVLLALSRLLPLDIGELIELHLGVFFVAAMVCHGELARSRPDPEHLTEYYLLMALGGVLGGLFNALVAPAIFDRVVEYPLVIALVCLLRPHWNATERTQRTPGTTGTETDGPLGPFGRLGRSLGTTAWIVFGLAMGVIFYGLSFLAPIPVVLHSERNFFGVLRVGVNPATPNIYKLLHGTTVHGAQDRTNPSEPLSYYYRDGPIGQVFTEMNSLGGSVANASGSGPRLANANIGVVGLGAGALAAYARPGQHWRFFEINPAVQRLAEDPRYFTYLADCRKRGVDLQVILGDARLTLEEGNERFFLLVLDAFSSDSIPIHLLTREALETYLKRLEPNGILAFHASSKYVQLGPVLANLARSAKLRCFFRQSAELTEEEAQASARHPSQWVIMARNEADFGAVAQDRRWRPLLGRADEPVWTDDYSNILHVFLWTRRQTEEAMLKMMR
jgi:hypothetical protein